MNDRRLLIATALIIAVIIAGEAYIYCNDWDDMYDVEISGKDVSIRADSSVIYDIVAIDNGSKVPSSRVVLYYDSDQGEKLDGTRHATGGTYLSQEYYISQLGIQLKNRGTATETMDADRLRIMMESAISSGRCNQSVVMVSGTIPDTVYSGDGSDLILRWLDMGGRIYWAGGIIGQYVSSSGGTVENLGSDRQSLFLGAVCQNPETTYGLSETEGGWRTSLCLAGNGTRYAVDPTMTESSLAMGYTDGRYSSVCLVGHGSGTVCILGGVLSNDQRYDMAQIVSAGVTDESVLVEHIHGSVTRSTVTETIAIDSSKNIMVYTYLGGYFTVYGRSASLR